MINDLISEPQASGLFAATWTALFELMAIPLIFALRSFIPRAALRSSVAGVSLTAITMGFSFEIFSGMWAVDDSNTFQTPKLNLELHLSPKQA